MYGMVCCAVLCCAVLCCAVLCCAVLWCGVVCCAVLFFAPVHSMEGCNVTDLERLKKIKLDRKSVAQLMTEAFSEQIFLHGTNETATAACCRHSQLSSHTHLSCVCVLYCNGLKVGFIVIRIRRTCLCAVGMIPIGHSSYCSIMVCYHHLLFGSDSLLLLSSH